MIMPGIESRNQGGREHATQPDPDQNLACRPFAAAQGLGGHAGAASGAEITDPVVIAAKVTPAIAETVKKQIEAGIDCIGDGEFWTARNLAHYAAHFTGVEARPVAPDEPPTTRHSTRERDEFPDFYGDCDRAG